MKWRSKLIQSVKLAIAAIVSIWIANFVELDYAISAGIITLLSIQNTKRETIQRARNRGLAFLCAIGIGIMCFCIFDFSLMGFGIYIGLFAFLCYTFAWTEAIVMCTVLMSHLFTEQSISLAWLMNEILLFIIGAGIGIIVNLHLRKSEKQFEVCAKKVDNEMKAILDKMAMWLPQEDKTFYKEKPAFEELRTSIDIAKYCAIENLNNSFRKGSKKELKYIEMREQQSILFVEIYRNIKRINYLPTQVEDVALLFKQLEKDFHQTNTVEGNLIKLGQLYEKMKLQQLPKTREEFEMRAILYYILLQIRKVLELKQEYILSMTKSSQ